MLTHELWRHGISDVVFNFTINNGVSENNSVSQIDFGEMTFNKSEVEKLIKSKIWFTRYSYTSQKNALFKAYIDESFEREFTVDKLNKFWDVSK